MPLSEGEVVAIVTGSFLVGTKVFDFASARFGTRVSTAIQREQALYDRIANLEERLDHKDADCQKRIDALEVKISLQDEKIELNKLVIENLRKMNADMSVELNVLKSNVKAE